MTRSAGAVPVRLGALILAAACALVLAACGALAPGGEGPAGRELSLALDGPWTAAHAGIALAEQRDYASGEGIGLSVRALAPEADPGRLVDEEEVDAAVMSIHELGVARRRARRLVAVAALAQRPLTGVLAGRGIGSPRELAGRGIALTGRPGEAAIARSIVAADGGDAESLDFQRGLEAPAEALERESTAAVTGALGLLGPLLEARGLEPRRFALPEYGGPVFPELLLVVKRYTLEDSPGAVRALVGTLGRGYREAQVDPESAASALAGRRPELDRALLLEQIDALAPAWTAGADYFGQLREPRLRAWARWAVSSGLLRRPPDVERAFAPSLLGG